MVYDEQLEAIDVATLSGDPMAMYMLNLEDLMPAFAQLHHGSDEIEEIAESLGYGHENMMMNKDIVLGTDGDDSWYDRVQGTSDQFRGSCDKWMCVPREIRD